MRTAQPTDPYDTLVVEIEPAAVWALLDESYRHIKSWSQWDLPHQARAPLLQAVQSEPETVGIWLRVYRIEMRREQAEALRHRSDELGDGLQQMPNRGEHDIAAALKRAARAFYQALRVGRPISR